MSHITPINYIIIEGPDCSGKTTLYNMLHKESDYQWNIQDRSALSMLVHAKYYGRDEFVHIEALKKELYNLNNQMIVLLPPWEVISQRFNSRGDDIQNIQSLRKIYSLFEEAVEEIQGYPNVTVIRTAVDKSIVSYLVETYRNQERAPMMNLEAAAKALVACGGGYNKEVIGINFSHYDFGEFSDVNDLMLNYEKEVEYYEMIKTKLLKKINSEISPSEGLGDINGKRSRRFIYSDDSCISLAHFLVRNETLECEFYLRSSDVVNILKYDLNFLKSLAREVYNKFDLINHCHIKVTIGSCHVIGN